MASLGPANAIAAAITADIPELRPVATPDPGLFGAQIRAPDLYPDDVAVRGYYVPVPPPPPFKARGSRLPVLVGELGGRQWTVHIHTPQPPATGLTPSLTVSTHTRLVRSDLVPFDVLPWAVATARPDTAERPGALAHLPVDFARRTGREAVGEAALLSGRLPVPTSRPPVRWPTIVEAFDPTLREFLVSASFLSLFDLWDRRAGATPARTGPSRPALRVLADGVRLSTGLGDGVSPNAHAATVREFLATVPKMEQRTTGRDPETDPIPTVRFADPPGSVPDVRPAYRCPKCGRLEILKTSVDPKTGFAHRRTLGCQVDIFPPYPHRGRDVFAAADAVLGP